jgi:hypothetical protein
MDVMHDERKAISNNQVLTFTQMDQISVLIKQGG